MRTLAKRLGLRSVIAVVAVLFTAAAIYTSLLFERRQDALSRVSRYDLSWTAAQTANELSRLGMTLGAYAMRDEGVTARDVELRYELFLSRLSLFNSATFQAFAQEDPRNQEIIDEMRRQGEALEPLIANLDKDGNVAKAVRILLELNPQAASLASAANHSGAQKVGDDQKGLLHLHWIYSGVTYTLVVGGLILLWSLSRQNRLLNETRLIAEKAQAQAESGSRAKTEFLAAMSHEIRTPLNGILGFTDLMLDRNDLSSEVRRYAERIQTSGAALLTVVNDVLDFSKIEAGAVDLNLRPFKLEAMVANCDSIVRKLAEAKSLQLGVSVNARLSGAVMGDLLVYPAPRRSDRRQGDHGGGAGWHKDRAEVPHPPGRGRRDKPGDRPHGAGRCRLYG
jgi:signal transduction histidine kinase